MNSIGKQNHHQTLTILVQLKWLFLMPVNVSDSDSGVLWLGTEDDFKGLHRLRKRAVQ